MIYVFDLDGTLADWTERYKHAGPEPSKRHKGNYRKWLRAIQDNKRLLEDERVPGMLGIVLALHECKFKLVYLTAREETYRKVTEQWIEKVGFPTAPLLMRSVGDWRATPDLKEDKLRDLQTLNPGQCIAHFDDDPSGLCSERYRKLGITHLKVMPIKSGGGDRAS